MKKIIALVSIFVMGLALFACGKKAVKSNHESISEIITINGKVYDLSKDCDEILQELMDTVYIKNFKFETDEPLRWMHREEIYDPIQNIFVYTVPTYYELDKYGQYVQKDLEDFDERVMMHMDYVNSDVLEYEMSDIWAFSMYGHELNAPDFKIKTPNGISIGDDVSVVKNMGAYEVFDNRYELIYLDGTLVNYSDYSADAERIQKLEVVEWSEERIKEYKYNCIQKEYESVVNNIDDKDEVIYLLAESDSKSKINTGEKATMLRFQYVIADGKVSNITFSVMKQSESGKENYKNFLENMKNA